MRHAFRYFINFFGPTRFTKMRKSRWVRIGVGFVLGALLGNYVYWNRGHAESKWGWNVLDPIKAGESPLSTLPGHLLVHGLLGVGIAMAINQARLRGFSFDFLKTETPISIHAERQLDQSWNETTRKYGYLLCSTSVISAFVEWQSIGGSEGFEITGVDLEGPVGNLLIFGSIGIAAIIHRASKALHAASAFAISFVLSIFTIREFSRINSWANRSGLGASQGIGSYLALGSTAALTSVIGYGLWKTFKGSDHSDTAH
jgi:hypothetical protein